MDPVKIAGVADRPTPKDGKDVLSFLGFTNFYRRFIHDYAHIAEPLNLLKRKGVVWRWDKPQREAFETLKTRITSEPILIQPDSSKPFRLECDTLRDRYYRSRASTKSGTRSLSVASRYLPSNATIRSTTASSCRSCEVSRNGDICWRARATRSKCGTIT